MPCPLPLIKGLGGFCGSRFFPGKRIPRHNSLAGPASLAAPASPGLANWLREQAVSLAFSTYRANRLLFLGVDEQPNPFLKLHERLFDRPMGLFVAGQSIWMAARCQLWRLDNLLAPGQLHEGGDRLYLPAASYTTGDVNAHELVLGADGQPIFVNTAFSCLAGIAPGCSFAPTWAPPFISDLAGDDRCHLNGIALKEGVTFSQASPPQANQPQTNQLQAPPATGQQATTGQQVKPLPPEPLQPP
jgi:uncharacterized protein (TIGR03032 family)